MCRDKCASIGVLLRCKVEVSLPVSLMDYFLAWRVTDEQSGRHNNKPAPPPYMTSQYHNHHASVKCLHFVAFGVTGSRFSANTSRM